MACVWGLPWSSRSGGPSPPTTAWILAPSVSTLTRSNPSNIVEEDREGLRFVHHVGGEHLSGDGPDVPRVVDDACRDQERVAGTKREGRPGVELHSYVASDDVPDLGTPRMAVPAGGDALGDLGEGLDYLPAGDRRGEALQDRKSTRLNSSHANISYAVFCLKKKTKTTTKCLRQRHTI